MYAKRLLRKGVSQTINTRIALSIVHKKSSNPTRNLQPRSTTITTTTTTLQGPPHVQTHSPKTHHLALRSANTRPLHVPLSPTLTTVSHVLPNRTQPSSLSFSCCNLPPAPPPPARPRETGSSFRVMRMIRPPGVCTASLAGLERARAALLLASRPALGMSE